MSHAPVEVRPVVLDGGAVDIPADETTTTWRAGDDACDVTLSDGSVVISVRNESAEAEAVRAEVQARIDAGDSTAVLASHLDALGFRQAVEDWARSH